MPRREVHCHKLVLTTAVEMAHELYATLMSDNRWYTRWKKLNPDLVNGPVADTRELEERFVARNVAKLVPQARIALAKCLASPALDEQQKSIIYEALMLDKSLMRGRPDNADTTFRHLGLTPEGPREGETIQ